MTNALSTLSSDGRFERLSPQGEIPSPRIKTKGFAYNGKLVMVGGKVQQMDESREQDFFKWKDILHNSTQFYTNEFYEYDPKTNIFKRLLIHGAYLSPRVGFALAILEDRVFIHGGVRNEEGLNDFYVLDMTSLKLAPIGVNGYGGKSICNHVAEAISDTQLLFVGGTLEGKVISHKVKIYDAKKNEWKDEDPISPLMGWGLTDFRSVSFSRKTGVSVLLVSGYNDISRMTHPRYMVLFNITFS